MHPAKLFRVGACLLAAALFAGPVGDAPVELRVLSYNTHGLVGWIAGDDPESRFPKISQRLHAYDVVLIQEDWSYHEELVSWAPHEVVERGNGSRLALASLLPIFGGSGLTTLVRSRDWLLDVGREPYDTCAGWLGGANDCFGTKGFLHVRLRLPPDRRLDVYQTHLDAGAGPDDQAARVHQLELLTERIAAISGDRALILAGDFNLDAKLPEQRAALDDFAQGLGLQDSRAAPAPGTAWRQLDYVFYRSGAQVEIELLEAGEALEFRDATIPLSDHPALFTRFRIR